jgi:hypothetical protein
MIKKVNEDKKKYVFDEKLKINKSENKVIGGRRKILIIKE